MAVHDGWILIKIALDLYAKIRNMFGSANVKECSNVEELLQEIYNYCP
jgi:hypothetical protein